MTKLTYGNGNTVGYGYDNLERVTNVYYNNSSSPALTYTYNAYGEILSVNNLTTDNLSTLNPLRYRGYYYDSDTNLYYVKSRYYAPAICRFINADGLASTGQGFLGCNMFAYCLNNPLVFFDDGGSKAKSYDETADDEDECLVFLCGNNDPASASFNSWQAAEQGTRDALGSVQAAKERSFNTPEGKRIVDSYNPSEGIIAESKYGYQSKSAFISSEIIKDDWLRDNNIVHSIEWHFYYSVRSGTVGPSGPLYLALDDANITIIIHQER